MGFSKMQATQYPPRLWGLCGYPGTGKSSFAAQMRGPLLPIDADHRFTEVLHLTKDVLELSPEPSDHVNPDRIATLLNANMPGAQVGTIVVDSLTAIITPFVVQAMVDKEQGREANLAAAFRGKALAMRQLQDAVTKWGTDVLWIYHLNDARDAKGKELTKATVSTTELIRLTRSINMQLEIVTKDSQRGVKIVWARRGRAGLTLWDTSGVWRWMPEKIEAAAYDGLTEEEKAKIEQAEPHVFQTPEIAITWGFEKGAFRAIEHARNAYDKLKRERNPQSAAEMAALWIADVKARLAVIEAKQGQLDLNGDE